MAGSNIDREWCRYWFNGPEQVAEALKTPAYRPRPVRTLDDMTPKEIREIEAHYQCKVKRNGSAQAEP